MTWYEKDKDTAVIKMYADIGWWGVSASRMTDLLEQLDAKYKTVIVRMHCFGGEVFSGNAIYNVIKSMAAHTICIVEGVCMSMGTIILAAFDEVHACENAIFMYHSPSTYGVGNARDLEQAAKLLRLMEKNFKATYKKKVKGELPEFFDGTDHYYDADGVMALGMVDKIVEPAVKDVKKIVITDDMSGFKQEDLYNKYAAYLVTDEDEQEEEQPATGKKKAAQAKRIQAPVAMNDVTNSNNDIMKKLLIEAFALVGLTEASSDTAVLQAVQAKLQEKDTKISELTTQVSAAAKTQAEGMITATEQAAGKTFEASQKESLLKVAATAGMDVFTAMLGLAVPTGAASADNGGQQQSIKTPTLHTMVSNSGGKPAAGNDSRADWDWSMWIAKDPEGLEAMEAKEWEKFSALYQKEFKAVPDRR